MKKLMLSMALAGLFLSPGAAMAEVKVSYAHPEKFADMPFSAIDREQVLKELTEHFSKLALPAGVDMKIEVLDLNLAGRLHMASRLPHEVRVLKGEADWPTMRLRYSLERDGKVVGSGEENLSNMMYMNRLNRYSSGDTLRYEKQMVDDWFKDKIQERIAVR